MSSYFWGGFSTTSTRQQRWLVRTVAGSLVAGACGYYGAHSRFLFFFFQFCYRKMCGRTLSKQREVFLFWSIDDIHIISVCPSRRRLTKPPSLSLSGMTTTTTTTTTTITKSRERDQRLAELQEVSKSDGAVRERVLRAE